MFRSKIEIRPPRRDSHSRDQPQPIQTTRSNQNLPEPTPEQPEPTRPLIKTRRIPQPNPRFHPNPSFDRINQLKIRFTRKRDRFIQQIFI
jgi:hypothetical protein